MQANRSLPREKDNHKKMTKKKKKIPSTSQITLNHNQRHSFITICVSKSQKVLSSLFSLLSFLFSRHSVKRISDNDFAQRMSDHITQLARNKALRNRQRLALKAGKRSSM